MNRWMLIAVALALPRAADAQDPLPARIDAIVAEELADESSAGVAVEVIHKAKVIVRKGYGKANVELDVPMTERNVFRIGSITKQFTAAGIMRLVERGKLKLDDDVGKLLPDAPLHGKHVTVAQLLTHTSGIKNYTELKELQRGLPLPPERLYTLLKDQSFDFEPGQGWHYSNSNYYLLGLIIEKVSGKKYRDFLRDEVIARAGLKNTSYCDNDPIIPNRAQGYTPDGPRLKNASPIDMSAPFAAGALCSTVDDLVVWAQALAGGKVVSAASYAKMTTPVKVPGDGKGPQYGFGLGLGDREGHRRIAHNGGINGFTSRLTSFPDDGLVVAVLANTDGGLPDPITARIVGEVLGMKTPVPNAVALPDPKKFIGDFKMTDKGELHLLHVFVEGGKLWVHDSFDNRTDRLDYQGGDEFQVAHTPLKAHIRPDAIDVVLPDATKMIGARVKK